MSLSTRHILLTVIFLSVTNLTLGQTLAVNKLNALKFGSQIFPGISKSIDRKDATAAKFEISGEAGRQVQITFQLPSYLTDANSNSLNINFSTSDAGYSTSELNQSSAMSFDPHTGVVTSLSVDGFLYIWLGGTVSPLDSQPGNPYAGDLTINVSYTN